MPYETTWEDNGVYQRYWGVLTRTDRVSASREVMSSPRFDELNYWIVDSRDIDSYELQPIDAKISAAHDIGASMTNGHVLMAFVATHPAHLPNIRLYMKLLEENTSWLTRLFGDIDSARDWIAQHIISRK